MIFTRLKTLRFGLTIGILLNPLLTWSNAPQDTCDPVDLRKKYSFLNFASSQGNKNQSCYAYAAADLVSFKLGRPISAIDLQNTFEQSWPGKTLLLLTHERGLPQWAIEEGMKKGFCSDEKVRSSNGVRVSFKSKIISDFKKTLLDLKQLQSKLSELPSDHRYEYAYCQASKIEGLSYFFPKMNLNEVANILIETESDEIKNRLIEYSCEKNRIQGNFEVMSSWGFGSRFLKKVSQVTDDQLDQGNAIVLGFRGSLLKNIYTSEGEHAAMIMGRRWDSERNQCEYLIKNTWGTDCKKPRLYDPFFLMGRCENGNLWIPGDLLLNRSHLYLYLK